MRYEPSALVNSLSGKTGGIVAASWKGVGYIRKHVIPKMGMASGQVAARAGFVLLSPLYRSLSATIMTYLDTYGTTIRKSGFNVFGSTVIPDIVAVQVIHPLPPNAKVAAVATFAAATGGGAAGTLALSWTDPALAGYTKMAFMARKHAGGLFEQENLAVNSVTAVATLTGLTAGVSYDVWGWLYNPTTGDMGTTQVSTATSHA
jgi:hypothetical protein